MPEARSPLHPAGLRVLFWAELWERFCFYGLRGLLVLYMTKALAASDVEAFAVYGAYTALTDAGPVVCGRVADRLLGHRRAVILGGALMLAGALVVVVADAIALAIGLGLLAVGCAWFKGSVSTLVGLLYADDDVRRDSGYTLFYVGVNVGALGAATIVAWVGERVGFAWGFALAAFGMLLGLAVFVRGRARLGSAGDAPDLARLRRPLALGLRPTAAIAVASIAAAAVAAWLVGHKGIVDGLLWVALIAVVVDLARVARREGPVARDRALVLVALMALNVAFWAAFEQAGSSLTLFADRNVDRNVLGVEIPAAVTLAFNPLFIIVLGTAFARLWPWLRQRGRDPSVPVKFALGMLQLGIGFLVVAMGARWAGADALAPLVALVVMYLLHTTGELFLSPIGLSMVGALAPRGRAGTAMGAWFLSFAFSNSLAASLASLTGVGTEGEDELAALSPAASLDTYSRVFGTVGWLDIGIAIAVLFFARRLAGRMHLQEQQAAQP